MQHFTITYTNDETGQNFTLLKDVETDHISGALNVMVDVLRLMTFSDDTISDHIGETYFEDTTPLYN